MARNAPGKHFREGISLIKVFRMFPDDATAEAWLTEQRWPDGVFCHYCGSTNVQSGSAHKTMPYLCREKECGKRFSLKTGTVMQASKLGYQIWVVALYLLLTSLKSVSSMKLHRDLTITQKTAWHLAHRIRKSFEAGDPLFTGPAEADETYFGGKERNKHAKKKIRAGRGTVGKIAVAGIRDRATGQVKAQVVPDTSAKTLQDFVTNHTVAGATVYTDDAAAYKGMRGRHHESVKHSVGEYVNDLAHTNGMESFWSMLKRAHKGTFHHLSEKRLDRYVAEFAGRHNVRESDTINQMASVAAGMVGKRLRYQDLVL